MVFALLLALVFGLAVVAAGCGGGDSDRHRGRDRRRRRAPTGGTLRLQTDAFEWTGNFDPTGEYLGTALGIYDNMLVRTSWATSTSPAMRATS